MKSEIVIRIDNLDFIAANASEEPWVRDVDLAARLEYSRPRDIRPLIAKLIREGLLSCRISSAALGRAANSGEFDVYSEEEVTARGTRGASQKVTVYYLSEAGAIFVASQSDTDKARKITRAIIGLFIQCKARLVELAAPPPAPPVPLLSGWNAVIAACKTVGQNPEWKRELYHKMGYAAYRTGDTWRHIAGGLRKHLGVTGYLQIPASLLDEARRFISSVESGLIVLPRKRPKAPIPNPAQVNIPFSGPGIAYTRPALVRAKGKAQ